MNWITRFLAPASLAISVCCPKVQLQTIFYHHLNIFKALFVSSKFSIGNCVKYSYMDNPHCDLTSDISDSCADGIKDIDFTLQKLSVTNTFDKNVNNLGVNFLNNDHNSLIKKRLIDKKKYKDIRKWKKVDKGNAAGTSKDSFIFKLLSFNILAQDLLETHSYLYRTHDKKALPWEHRKPLLMEEILELNAHVICLQEVQYQYLQEILIPFQENGFTHLYKKRTNDKKDGLLVLYKEDLFNLLEFSKVELYQNGIELLSRDNVGLVAKFSLKESPETKFVVATTHLLFNPRRNDVRLGQIQLLFAEIERIAFVENTLTGPRYLPIVLSGDFNLEPYSGVYNFVTEGSIEFVGKGRNLEESDYRCLSNSLIPPHLYVTDECQHLNVLSKRLSGIGSGKIMLRNAENQYQPKEDDLTNDLLESTSFNSKTNNYQKIEISDGHYVTFSSGLLTHPFRFKSVYNHTDKNGRSEATTFQNRWITVDYIFYSQLTPLEKYRLPTAEECSEFLPTIPNAIVGSDHFCLGASFLLKKR
ncbi:protein angel-like [Phymastichus coffea]|uniref:protein angel-like n=1 Tax=Phymastichus coffea TaxID=108790 RepID=UPI00273B578A|nr:protein angel-like [Phymastichus coffea]XP_058790823.1 protein angel-like [Phymastichus coffea]XP_058790824.1 protein angel-like [Phymastichus coffea]XP_058790825.1 protein angel-like [Phymastichus coffea]